MAIVSIRHDLDSPAKKLFQTGDYEDLQFFRRGSVLVISVVERPAIDSIDVSGNSAIPTEALLEAMSRVGLSEGELFKRSTIESVSNELRRQYVSQGRYGSEVEVKVDKLSDNRVALSLDISEGSVSSIVRISILGNKAIDDGTILRLFDIGTRSRIWNWATSRHRYARERLTGDIERLQDLYLDRGYLEMAITDVSVSISEDRSEVFLAITVREGKPFNVAEVKFNGSIPFSEQVMLRQIFVQPGERYSQRKITQAEQRLTTLLNDFGYTFASGQSHPKHRRSQRLPGSHREKRRKRTHAYSKRLSQSRFSRIWPILRIWFRSVFLSSQGKESMFGAFHSSATIEPEMTCYDGK